MRNILFISLFLQIANFLSQRVVDSAPISLPIVLCNSADQTVCERSPVCYWNQFYCNNKVDCTKIPLGECAQTKPCHLNPPALGYCYSAIKLNCQQFNQDQCLSNPLCDWLLNFTCTPQDPQPAAPNCAAYNSVQCLKNSQYCNLTASCQDKPNYCQGLNYNQCQNDPKCNYVVTQKEQCLENGTYCKNLNEKQCLQNKFCYGQYLAPKCINNYDCGQYSAILCKKSSQICDYKEKPYTCTRKQNKCDSYTNVTDCKKAGCSFGTTSDGEFNCFYPYACEKYTEKQCKDNNKFCDYTPGSYSCTNKLDCSELDDPILCKANKFCKFIPSKFQCFPKKESCFQLNALQCLKNNACTYIPPKGYCTQASTFGCSSKNLLGCFNDKHCMIKYQCTPKTLPTCKDLTYAQCKESSYCKLLEYGKCFNKEIDCNLPYEQCIATRPCQWNPGSNGSCINEIECKGLTLEDCKNNEYCKISGGCSTKAAT